EFVGQRDHRAAWRIVRPRHYAKPARLTIRDATTRELFQQQRTDVPAAVEANVDHQPFAIDLAEEASMKLRITPRSHVRHVPITATSVGLIVNPLAVPLDPLAVAEELLVLDRLDHHDARILAVLITDVERDLGCALVDEQLRRRDVARRAPPVDGQ